MKIIYVDNNATTRVAPEVYEAMKPYFTDYYFNPSSMYEPARQTGHAISEARKTIADSQPTHGSIQTASQVLNHPAKDFRRRSLRSSTPPASREWDTRYSKSR